MTNYDRNRQKKLARKQDKQELVFRDIYLRELGEHFKNQPMITLKSRTYHGRNRANDTGLSKLGNENE